MSGLLAVAEQLAAAGLSVIPIGVLADKAPAAKLLPLDADGKATWAPFQERLPTGAELKGWYGPAAGIGIVGGAVSGGLTIMDFDVRDGVCLFEQFAEQVEALAPGLLADMPLVQSQRGGRHLYYRCTDCSGPADLASAVNGKKTIETKTQGGYCVAPRTPGYKTLRGSLTKVPTISPEERALLFAVARSFDAKPPLPELQTESLPGAAYNARATLDDMERELQGAGWRVVGTRQDGTRLLRRPGKDHGISATLGQGGHKSLYVFTSSAPPFDAGAGYSPFAVRAMTRHRGDYTQAASALARDGYGVKTAGKTVDPAPATAEAPARPHIMKLAELLGMSFPDTKEIIPGIIQEGSTLFMGKPKSGKSWTMLHFSLVVAYGGKALGSIDVEAGDVLHLALEDGPKLLAKRFKQMLGSGRIPERLEIATEWPRFTEGGLTEIEAWLQDHPRAALVVIDTLQAIRGTDDPKKDSTRQDYEALAPLTALSHKYSVAIVIVHHQRKMEAADIFDTGSGTLGLNAAVDSTAVLVRQIFAASATLAVRGRDIEEHEMGLVWDKDLSQWNYLGSADEVRLSTTRKKILETLGETEEALTPKEISERSGLEYNNVTQRLFEMKKSGQVSQAVRGKYYVRTGFVQDSHKDRKDRKFTLENETYDDESRKFGPDETYGETYGENGSHQSKLTELTKLTATSANKCPGCGKDSTWKPAPYDPDRIICSNCGVDKPPGHTSPAYES